MITKLNPKTPPADICQTSIDWLKDYARIWFASNVPDHGQIWFADDNISCLSKNFPNPKERVEIVFTGSFLIRFLEAKFWPHENFRIWTFSERVRIFLRDVFKIPEHQIGYIGRTDSLSSVSAPDFKQEVNFVYSGRLSFSKNITALLRLTSFLQDNLNLKVTLDLYGEPDEFHDQSLGRFSIPPMQSVLNDLINKLPWKDKPVFHGKVPQASWLKVKRPNPVFISLSTSMYEDFGTAVAIAANAGWFSILSDWGGHAEATNAVKIPENYLPRSHEPEFLQVIKTRMLATKLMERKFLQTGTQVPSKFVPNDFKLQYFLPYINDFVKRCGPEILLCLRDMEDFADTPKGIELFRDYHHVFGPTETKHAWIVNDLKKNSESDALPINEPFDVIYLRELFNPYFVRKLPTYETITLVQLGQDLPIVLNYLKNSLGLDCEIRSHDEDR